MTTRFSQRARRALNTPRFRDLLHASTDRPQTAENLARTLRISLRTLGGRLSALKRYGLARRVTVYDPTRLGRPVQAITYVSMILSDDAQRVAFERRCREDSEITTAVQITGVFDYALTTFHRDERVARAWLRLLRVVPGVGKTEQKLLDVQFGHTLRGAPLLWSPGLDTKARRHAVP